MRIRAHLLGVDPLQVPDPRRLRVTDVSEPPDVVAAPGPEIPLEPPAVSTDQDALRRVDTSHEAAYADGVCVLAAVDSLLKWARSVAPSVPVMVCPCQ